MSDQTASDMDGGWKQVIDDFLEDFFLFFFPAIHSLIDFREKCQLLDKELAALVAGSATGRRHVDKLIEVHWKDGAAICYWCMSRCRPRRIPISLVGCSSIIAVSRIGTHAR